MNGYKLTPKTLPAACAWTEKHIATLAEGGVWGVPRSGTMVTVFHSKKEVQIQKGFMPDPSIPQVFKAMGWKVV